VSARFPKAYLGDGVYAEANQYGAIVLTTENGIATTNRIMLEPEVLVTFERWLRACREWAKVEADRAAKAGAKP
jgi:hypothetical protein